MWAWAQGPILIDSRTAKAQEKLHSIALAKLMCDDNPAGRGMPS